MKTRTLTLQVALIIGVFVSPASLLAEGRTPIVGKPVVLEGDLLTVGSHKFRLYGIDAPEKGQTCQAKSRVLDCGRIAATGLMDLTAGVNSVSCEPLGPDPAGVMIVRCLDPQGFDLSRQMLYTGWALATPKSSKAFHDLEAKSRAAKRGLWKWQVTPPWVWRAAQK